MIANYHTHTYRCHHARGFEWQYVQNAAEGGLKILGFSDHIPNPFERFDHLGVRMRCRQLPEYIKTVRQLKEQFKEQMTIHCGLEAEYHPKRFPKQLELMDEAGGVDYLLLGQHFIINEDGSYTDCTLPFGEEQRLASYVDQVLEGLSTGKFLYLCHPDIVHFTGDESVYRKQMRRLCQEAKRMDIPLELNGQGLRTKRIYPRPLFWELAAEEGNLGVIGTDAHSPWVAYDPQEVEALSAIAQKYHIPILETLEDRL